METDEKIRVLERQDKEYPRRLREIPGAPKRLYVLGKLPEEQIPTVAVIGARDCSEYGKYVAAGLGAALGRSGIQVVSGMARGIDGISQEAALDAGGSSFAVLGSGVDVCYPAGNRQLYEKLKEGGGILSEYPPGTPPVSGHFPPRNRIVSGLSDAVVVVEAREKSGTLITVDMALEQGREVYVVPGRVTDSLSSGCNRLLKLGAGLLLNREEFIEEVREICVRKGLCGGAGGGIDGAGHDRWEGGNREVPGLTEAQRALLAERPELLAVYGALDFMPGSVEQIREKLPEQYRGTQISVHLIRLCMEKLAVQVSPGQFCLGGRTVQ
ncbi:MAG: DNA-processing protein DprA [Butyrivibrio sp.]|nr:DNA-processing protein DprA [Acetatifactor muris]MCM1558102.1 DNA-processing protein DprA [Butyrivibrio sp.]MCM1560465.1 DNA-processing protein DprA [Butyrivibrio sp.]